jgi:hypothetical protein
VRSTALVSAKIRENAQPLEDAFTAWDNQGQIGEIMSSAALELRHLSIISDIEDKNSRAEAIIRRYARKHALMDIGVGLVSLAPGAAIPAIIAAVALQSTEIYKPMANELASVYLANTDFYTDDLGNVASVATVALEFAQEFAIEFLAECAQELITEAGMGALATFIPIGGAFVAAGLDYIMAQMLTRRVGTMTAIYFQYGAQWVGSRKTTMAISKELTGGLMVSASEAYRAGKALITRKAVPEANTRINLDDIPARVPQVKKSGIDCLISYIADLADDLPKEKVRSRLIKRGFSPILIEDALARYYS